MSSGTIIFGSFEWNSTKEKVNFEKHGISFEVAIQAFADPKRIIVKDEKHSEIEQRFFCLGKVGKQVLTVRFTYRENVQRIRIIGAGCWRKETKFYEEHQ